MHDGAFLPRHTHICNDFINSNNFFFTVIAYNHISSTANHLNMANFQDCFNYTNNCFLIIFHRFFTLLSKYAFRSEFCYNHFLANKIVCFRMDVWVREIIPCSMFIVFAVQCIKYLPNGVMDYGNSASKYRQKYAKRKTEKKKN